MHIVVLLVYDFITFADSNWPKMKGVKIHDKDFVEYISSDKIQERISEVGRKIQEEMGGDNPLFLGILNGCFRFSSDLLSHIDATCEINFLKVSSYSGTATSGKVSELIGLNTSIEIGRAHV